MTNKNSENVELKNLSHNHNDFIASLTQALCHVADSFEKACEAIQSNKLQDTFEALECASNILEECHRVIDTNKGNIRPEIEAIGKNCQQVSEVLACGIVAFKKETCEQMGKIFRSASESCGRFEKVLAQLH
jgi:hypothetical protein